MIDTHAYEAVKMVSGGVKQAMPLARDEIAGVVKQLTERQMAHRMRLEQLREETRFLERELNLVEQSSESLQTIIRRSEEVDVPTPLEPDYPRYR